MNKSTEKDLKAARLAKQKEKGKSLSNDETEFLEKWFLDNGGLVGKEVYKYAGKHLRYDDLYQAGYLGMWEGLCSYDPERGRNMKVTSYCVLCIKRSIQSLRRKTDFIAFIPHKERTRRDKFIKTAIYRNLKPKEAAAVVLQEEIERKIKRQLTPAEIGKIPEQLQTEIYCLVTMPYNGAQISDIIDDIVDN